MPSRVLSLGKVRLDPIKRHGQGGVFDSVQDRDQVEELEHKAHLPPAQLGEVVV
jgi:hypothetical protein